MRYTHRRVVGSGHDYMSPITLLQPALIGLYTIFIPSRLVRFEV